MSTISTTEPNAVNMIVEAQTAFTSGDAIYGGDASNWKKFDNSLKCRLAIHLSEVGHNWKQYIAAAVASGVFESNDDAAKLTYSSAGYPVQLIRPDEITCVYSGANVLFTPLNETKGDIIERVKYPTNESTLNGANWKEAVLKLTDGTNNYYSKMYWDARTSSYEHPANK